MRHFLDVASLRRDEVSALISRALYFKQSKNYPQYIHSPVVHLFYENSTRTRMSFELAAKQLSMPVIHWDAETSSESKGEVIQDTVKTLAAMRIKIFVIRHAEAGLPLLLAKSVDDDVSIINAGVGVHAHPSQAMLDVMTILEKKPNLNQLKIAVVGNVRHSRVANSLQALCAVLGVGELVCVAPKVWQPTQGLYTKMTTSLFEGIAGADVVMCLRVQKERLSSGDYLDLDEYHRDYALTQASLKYAKPDVMILHPGPMNRGVEIDSDVADGPQSSILRQVENGVFMRMAILEYVMASKG